MSSSDSYLEKNTILRKNSTSCELILFLSVSLLTWVTWVMNFQIWFFLMFVGLFLFGVTFHGRSVTWKKR